jgi:DNA-binding NarL/FixJ family response regulator
MMSLSESSATKRVAKIAIVDDHPLIVKGYRELIDTQSDLEFCGEAAGEPEALDLINKTNPDLVVVDLSLRDGTGLGLIKKIKARHQNTKVLVASMHDEFLFAERVLRTGAEGYISKQEAPDRFVDAIRKVLSGKIYLSSRMEERMLQVLAGKQGDMSLPLPSKLSNRELEVFEYIGQGLSTRQIAEQLHLSIKTIETHRESIKQKLNVQTSSELTCHAVQWVLERQG